MKNRLHFCKTPQKLESDETKVNRDQSRTHPKTPCEGNDETWWHQYYGVGMFYFVKHWTFVENPRYNEEGSVFEYFTHKFTTFCWRELFFSKTGIRPNS